MDSEPTPLEHDDAAQLATLGHQSELKRNFSSLYEALPSAYQY